MNSIHIYEYALQEGEKVIGIKKHYNGDIVRRIILSASLVIIVLTPFFIEYIPLPFFLGLAFALLLNIFSGLTNPKVVWTSVFDLVLGFVGTLVFGYFAIDAYLQHSVLSLYFWINEMLAGIFFISLYFSIKTVRGFYIRGDV